MGTEAAARETTTYLVDKRIDMLPSLLGTNMCSLWPFAFSAIWICSAVLASKRTRTNAYVYRHRN